MRKLKNEELGRLSVDQFKQVSKMPVTLLLDNVRSLHNVGSAFRTSDAFRVERIFLSGITGQPPHREINKTALGATESVDWEYQTDPASVVEQLKASGHQIILVEQMDQAMPLSDFQPAQDQHHCFVFGNEIHGVSESLIGLADHVVEIPQYGTKHSLNVAVSIGVILWDFICKTELRS